MQTLVRGMCGLGAVLRLACGALEVEAQAPASGAERKFHRSASIGVSFFQGDEGDNTGAHVTATMLRALGASKNSARFDFIAHYFTPQPLYPCGLQLDGTCFQTSQRSVIGGAVGVEHGFSRAQETPRSRGLYAAASVAAVLSRRVAAWLPNCEPDDFCPPEQKRRTINDPSGGALLALGHATPLSRGSIYGEASLLLPVFRKRTEGDPYKSYWIFPITIGVRF
jgi:hypothetical protein